MPHSVSCHGELSQTARQQAAGTAMAFESTTISLDSPAAGVMSMQSHEHVARERALPLPGEERVGAQRLGRPKLTKYELARLLGTRAAQLSHNDVVRCDVGRETNVVCMAQMELTAGVFPPYEVRRYHPDGTWERWQLRELSL